MNIIIKTAVAGEFAFETLSAHDIYNKEIEFYSKIAPKIDEALRKLDITGQLFAKSYGVCKTNTAILFEDLKAKDYCISSIIRGFNFDEAKAVLKKAATFHAINAVLQEENPGIFENFKYGKFSSRFYSSKKSLTYCETNTFSETHSSGLMSRHTDVFDVFYLTQLDVVIEVLSEWPNGDYYIDKLKRVQENVMKKGARAFAPDASHFNTLIHGDLCVKNAFSSCNQI